MATTTKTVRATEINVWVLAQLMKGARETYNGVARVDAPHIRRCVEAGLVVVQGRYTLSLTDAGVVAVAGIAVVR